jgi:hypothetical protein
VSSRDERGDQSVEHVVVCLETLTTAALETARARLSAVQVDIGQFLASLMSHRFWKWPLQVVLLFAFLAFVVFVLAFIDENGPKAAHLLAPLFQAINVNPEIALPVVAILVVVGIAYVIWRWTRRLSFRLEVLSRQSRLGLDAGQFALDDAKALRDDLTTINSRLHKIEKKLGLDVPDILPQFMKEVFRELEGKSPLAYRYIGGSRGEYYMGIPARDLTEDDYRLLSDDQRQLVDHGKLYSRIDSDHQHD